jgi:hypothetical protein
MAGTLSVSISNLCSSDVPESNRPKVLVQNEQMQSSPGAIFDVEIATSAMSDAPNLFENG